MVNQTSIRVLAFIFALLIFLVTTNGVAAALLQLQEPSSDDLYSIPNEFINTSILYSYLKEEGWIRDGVTYNEFDYIVTMVQQMCTLYSNVRPILILAMIAQESRYLSTIEYEGAVGLMQLMPIIYESRRMSQFIQEDRYPTRDDAFDVRLSICCGIDYMSYILGETNGDETYALMWYNEGAISAGENMYQQDVSYYAKTILELAYEIEEVLTPN